MILIWCDIATSNWRRNKKEFPHLKVFSNYAENEIQLAICGSCVSRSSAQWSGWASGRNERENNHYLLVAVEPFFVFLFLFLSRLFLPIFYPTLVTVVCRNGWLLRHRLIAPTVPGCFPQDWSKQSAGSRSVGRSVRGGTSIYKTVRSHNSCFWDIDWPISCVIDVIACTVGSECVIIHAS